MAELVVKPANESGGAGLLIGNRATEAEIADRRDAIIADPRNWVAQPILSLSTAPTLCDGSIEPRHLDLRPFILTGATELRDGRRPHTSGVARGFARGELVAGRRQQRYVGDRDTRVRRSQRIAMALLSRVAEQLYWAARYLERAEDTVRIVRAYTDVLVDLPTSVVSSWEPLLAVTGTGELHAEHHDKVDENTIVTFLVADESNPNCIVNSVASARENLRSAREVLPREAWQVVNDLYLYVASHRSDGISRRSRSRFTERVIADCQRLDGILERDDEPRPRLRVPAHRSGDRARRHDRRACSGFARPPSSVAPISSPRCSGWVCCDRCRHCRCTSAPRARRSTAPRSSTSCCTIGRSRAASCRACRASATACRGCHAGDQLAPALCRRVRDRGAGERRRARRCGARRRDGAAANRDREAERCHHRNVCRRPPLAGRCLDTGSNPAGTTKQLPNPARRADSWRLLSRSIALLTPSDIAARQRQADRLVEAEGASYLFHDSADDRSRPWRLDPLPLVISGAEWKTLESGIAQRVRVLNRLIDDVYGEQQLLRAAHAAHRCGVRVARLPVVGPWHAAGEVELAEHLRGRSAAARGRSLARAARPHRRAAGRRLRARQPQRQLATAPRCRPSSWRRFRWRRSSTTCGRRSTLPRHRSAAARARSCSRPASATRRTSSTATSPPTSATTSRRWVTSSCAAVGCGCAR